MFLLQLFCLFLVHPVQVSIPPYLDISDSDCKPRRLLLLLPFFFVSAANANFKLIVACRSAI